MTGKTCVVTGGSRGIGLETVKALVAAGAKVVVGVRAVAASTPQLRDEALAGNVTVMQLDLRSLASVRLFASAVTATVPQIDVLIHCASTSGNKGSKTADGVPLMFGVNHLAVHALTCHLLPRIISSGTRVVVVACGAAALGDINLRTVFTSPSSTRQQNAKTPIDAFRLLTPTLPGSPRQPPTTSVPLPAHSPPRLAAPPHGLRRRRTPAATTNGTPTPESPKPSTSSTSPDSLYASKATTTAPPPPPTPSNGVVKYLLRRLLPHSARVYCASKLANLMFAAHLGHQLRLSPATVLAVDPGFTSGEGVFQSFLPWYLRLPLSVFAQLSPRVAATRVVHAATQPLEAVPQGAFFRFNRLCSNRPPLMDDAGSQDLLWKLCAQLAKLDSSPHVASAHPST